MKTSRALPALALPALVLSLIVAWCARAHAQQNFALAFDSGIAEVRVPHTNTLNAYPLTIMCWFKTAQTNGLPALVNRYFAGSLSGYQLFMNNGRLGGWYFRDGANHVWGNLDGGFVADGLWHHAAFVVDDAGDRLYVDGALKSSVPWTGTPGATTVNRPLVFGVYAGVANGFFNGQMDDVTLWSTNLSAAQIQGYAQQPPAGNEAGLVGYWRFNELGGSIAINSAGSGSGLNGTLVSGPFRVALPRLVTTVAATGLTTNTATLKGIVNPGGLATTAWFEWGRTPLHYGNKSAMTHLAAVDSMAMLSQALTGLTPGLTYRYRLVASNSLGMIRGQDMRFWAPFLTVNGSNPYFLKHQAFSDPGATAHAAPVTIGTSFYNYSLALKADGTVIGWGDSSDSHIPPNTTNLIAIAAGVSHSLGLKADGNVNGWGLNYSGQIDIPPSATNMIAIAAGVAHSLGLKADGAVIAWGNNNHGQINVPPGAVNAVAIAAGQGYCLALKPEGTVIAWGDNSDGQINVPPSLANAVAIAAGSFHSLALKADGTVIGWGRNDDDQITIPPTAANVVAIAAGYAHSLALKTDGTVIAWGNNFGGSINIPAGATNVVAIAAGGSHSLALKADGTVIGWGNNNHGQVNVPRAAITNLNLPVASAHNVNTNVLGSYEVDYFVTNAYGVVATASRAVLVIDSPTITDPSATLIATNAINALRTVRFSASVNPNGSSTMVSIAYGLTASYGDASAPSILPGAFTPQLTTIDVALSPGFTWHGRVVAANGMDSIPGSAFSPDQVIIVPAAYQAGDLDGDGTVDQSELDAVYANYLPASPWLAMTNVAGLGGTNVTFTLGTSVSGAYRVEASTNLTDWQFLGPATPRYLFTDTNAPAVPERYYRLRYP